MELERLHRRRVCQFVLAGLTLNALMGCGGGKGNGTSEVALGELTRVELGQAPWDFPKVAVNSAGEAAFTHDIRGWYGMPAESGGATYHAYCLTRDGWKDLHPGVGDASVAVDINDRGQVLLFSTEQSRYENYYVEGKRAFLYSEGTFTEIRPAGVDALEVLPIGLSADGTVVGSYKVRSGDSYTGSFFLWRNGEMTLLEHSAKDINASGQILVELLPSDSLPRVEQAIRQPDGQIVSLYDLIPEGETFYAAGIKDDGTLYGWSGGHAAILRDGVITRIAPMSDNGHIDGVSPSGDVYGLTTAGPFLRRSNGAMVSLTTHMPLQGGPQQVLGRFYDMNQQGQVVGSYYWSHNGSRPLSVAFLLTPPSLAKYTGSASVRLSNIRTNQLDPNPFMLASVTGSLVTPRHLEALISTPTSSNGYRRLSVSLKWNEPIETGKTYPALNSAYAPGDGAVVFLHNHWNGTYSFHRQRRGSLIVDSITNDSVTFRIVNLEMDNGGICNGAGCPDDESSFVLNATITVRR